ncbi:hypothetical protein NIES970_16870 [[Synechococcus] sp. NIES-970]|uniref:hypothetical protein n=1 Tax=Picosynechococcus sp. NKBG15041c TaxID=1407650 RepID=UPI0003F8D477|nr:hypothetical protein [Picosynechococcus sp. NKBG15041c]BAW96748.1 hypothetical protein NIES970_16870 [[Synechococcus] sp. NIES-970]
MPLLSVVTEAADLSAALQDLLAQPGQYPAKDIPLSLCFRRPGLGFRSAIARKLAHHQAQVPQQLAQQYLEQITATVSPTNNATHLFTYEAIATPQGWLEFSLIPLDIGRWLDQVIRPQAPISITLDADLLFSCHYLRSRCQELSDLAAVYHSTQLPQWHFHHSRFPAWEQTLLEAIARYVLAALNHQPKPHLLATVEKSLWEFHRHCSLFGYLQQQPTLGCHYWQWLKYLAQFFQNYLPPSQDFLTISKALP